MCVGRQGAIYSKWSFSSAHSAPTCCRPAHSVDSGANLARQGRDGMSTVATMMIPILVSIWMMMLTPPDTCTQHRLKLTSWHDSMVGSGVGRGDRQQFGLPLLDPEAHESQGHCKEVRGSTAGRVLEPLGRPVFHPGAPPWDGHGKV